MTHHETLATTTPAWTLPDVLSSFRYWGYLLALLLAGSAMHALWSAMPMIAGELGAGITDTINVFTYSAMMGSAAGAAMALILMPSRPGLTLMLPAAGFAAGLALIALAPHLWVSPLFLTLLGVCVGAFTLLPLIALVGVVLDARLSRTDVIRTLALPALLLLTLPNVASIPLFNLVLADGGLRLTAIVLLACTTVAMLLLAMLRRQQFSGTAPSRRAPLDARHRSPVGVAIIGMIPVLVLLAYIAFLVMSLVGRDMPRSPPAALLLIGGILILGAAIYVLHWVYRIHGEAAGLMPPHRLLTPLASLLIVLFAPLGYLLVLVLLGDAVRTRAHEQGSPDQPSYRWLVFWSLIAPPIAMGMIQHAVNALHPGER